VEAEISATILPFVLGNVFLKYFDHVGPVAEISPTSLWNFSTLYSLTQFQIATFRKKEISQTVIRLARGDVPY